MIKFDVKLDTSRIIAKTERQLKVGQFVLDQQVLKDSNFFIPKDTGELERSGVRASRIGEGIIKWDTPYARRLYYNPQYDFSEDANPHAQGLWYEAARATFISDWVRITNQAIKGL